MNSGRIRNVPFKLHSVKFGILNLAHKSLILLVEMCLLIILHACHEIYHKLVLLIDHLGQLLSLLLLIHVPTRHLLLHVSDILIGKLKLVWSLLIGKGVVLLEKKLMLDLWVHFESWKYL